MPDETVRALTCYASEKLDLLLARSVRDASTIMEKKDIAEIVAFFAEIRDLIQGLERKTAALTKFVETLSRETIPTLFTNLNIKTVNVPGVGRVTINNRWSASIREGERLAAMEWINKTHNDWLIIETVSAPTLAAFAQDMALEGRPLPTEIFNVKTRPYVSVTPTEAAYER